MVVFLEFSLLGKDGVERNVKMNKDDPNEIYVWKDKHTRGMLKNPYWWKCAIIFKDEYHVIVVTHRQYKLHRVCYYAHNPVWNIYDTSRNNQIDHKDRNKLNNHISNLRVATHAENQQNTDAKGYHYCNTHKCWIAALTKNGKQYHKICKTEEEAIEARAKLKATHHSF